MMAGKKDSKGTLFAISDCILLLFFNLLLLALVIVESSRYGSPGFITSLSLTLGIKQEDRKYKHTVDLPKTTFGMRANSSVREPEIQKLWEENQVFKKVIEKNSRSLDQKARKDLTPLKLREKAAKFAKETVKNQMSSFKVPSLF
ncbi:hypothetical protein RJT34_16708 [Clitoria ternatea]|uniref:Uncharacterized protein n=1 Tax=Clitoria ternatea TaxID=43366 RepID=A0AAN9J9Q3_CLITE